MVNKRLTQLADRLGRGALPNFIQTLIYDDLGKMVLESHNEKFKSKNGIENLTKYQDKDEIKVVNIPRAFSYNSILLKNHSSGLLSPSEILENWNSIPEKDETYAETNSVVIYPNPGQNEDLRKTVLRILGKQSISTPHIVSNLGVEPADDDRGFTFVGSDFLYCEEAPYLQKHCSLVHNGKKIVESDSGVPIWVYKDGLHRLGRECHHFNMWAYMRDSIWTDRVQFLFKENSGNER